MKLNWKTLLMAVLMSVSVAAFAGCGDKKDPDDGGTNNQTEDYGTLTIADVKVCITDDRACTFAEIVPVFSKPDKAETLTYTYDTSEIRIENGIVTPLKRIDKKVNVRAKSEHFNVVFGVEVERLRFGDSMYDVTRFPVSVRAATCKAVTADTTLFIGDSFMDDYFIGDYMSTYSSDKVVLNAGMSSTTSYHWEAAYRQIIGGAAPKNIVLHVGTNNFYDMHDLADETEESLTRLFMLIHSSYPASNLYWFNITQRTNTAYSSQVTETNSAIADWCKGYDWITCVDTCSKVTGSMLKDDGVHPKTETYKVFTDALVAAGCQIVPKS